MSQYSLFDDKNLQKMFDNLPPEEKATYKRQGEHMYSKDYEVAGSAADRFTESAAYVCEGLKSGLLPSQLSSDEREIMISVYGRFWYEKFGYTSENDYTS